VVEGDDDGALAALDPPCWDLVGDVGATALEGAVVEEDKDGKFPENLPLTVRSSGLYLHLLLAWGVWHRG